MLFTLSGCSSSTSNKTDDITETKTFLYNYDYETDSNGEVSTAYNEEKPSVDANEPQITEEPIVVIKISFGFGYVICVVIGICCAAT